MDLSSIRCKQQGGALRIEPLECRELLTAVHPTFMNHPTVTPSESGHDVDPGREPFRVLDQPPAVVGVWVGGTGLGYSSGGFSIPVGSANQLRPLSWAGVNQIRIAFSEDVVVGRDDLMLFGVRTPVYNIVRFEYDTSTWTGTWTLAAILAADRVVINLADAVTDLDRNALDGEWIPTFSFYPSGDTSPGGDFRFPFAVLAGDVNGDGTVNFGDAIEVLHQVANPAGANAGADVNADGSVNLGDALAVLSRLRVSLLSLQSMPPVPGGTNAELADPIVDAAFLLRRHVEGESEVQRLNKSRQSERDLVWAIDELLADKVTQSAVATNRFIL